MTMFWSSENGRMSDSSGDNASWQRSVVTRIFAGVRIPRRPVAAGTINIADDLVDIDGLRSGGDPAVDENAVDVHRDFDTNQSVRLLPHGGGNDGFGNGIGQPIGMSRGKGTR